VNPCDTKVLNNNDNILYYHQNHIGSTALLTDNTGNEFQSYLYKPYGEMWVQDGNPLSVITRLYTGQEYDKESGLYYMNARYYDPRVGMFTTSDPVMDGANHYAYANCNPIMYNDPTGMVTVTSKDDNPDTPEIEYNPDNDSPLIIDFEIPDNQEKPEDNNIPKSPGQYSYDSSGSSSYADNNPQPMFASSKILQVKIVTGITKDNYEFTYMAKSKDKDAFDKIDIISENMQYLGWNVEEYLIEFTERIFASDISGLYINKKKIPKETITEKIDKIPAIGRYLKMANIFLSMYNYIEEMNKTFDGSAQLQILLLMKDGGTGISVGAQYIGGLDIQDEGTLEYAKQGAFYSVGLDQRAWMKTYYLPLFKLLKEIKFFVR
jgi:RHS repeat-associated protein